MKSYSWQGASPHVSWIPSDQKGVAHFEHVWRVNPCFRNSSTSYSLSGIFGLRTNGRASRFSEGLRQPNPHSGFCEYVRRGEVRALRRVDGGNCLEERPLTAFIVSLF